MIKNCSKEARKILEKYPKSKIMGHNEFPGVKKACPSFDVRKWVNDCDFYDY